MQTLIDNVYEPVDGSVGRKITNFNSQQSADGKTVGILRSHSDSDAVLLEETKP
ncbi:MAG TPA: hypothetical protein VJQ54_23845 [Candidatus Sulfotelmatobacter sp.]|nr:hypothetical protein [Candidatus Sulfotelmatobacter sp.]